MKCYWPNAIVICNGNIERRFTYDSSNSLDEAKRVIRSWMENHNTIPLCSWIVHSWDKKVVCFKEYNHNIQTLEWSGAKVENIPERLYTGEQR